VPPGPGPRRRDPTAYQAVHRTIVAVDVAGYGDYRRTSPHRLVLRQALYQALQQAFDVARVPWQACERIDCGDGVLVLVPPEIPKSVVVDSLPRELADRLRRHNDLHQPEEQFGLRMALHAGEIVRDEYGVTAPAINHAFRLLAAPPVKAALVTGGPLAMITSAWFYDEVVRQCPTIDSSRFRPVEVAVKETYAVGWLALPATTARTATTPCDP
jgi:hypothetical protein